MKACGYTKLLNDKMRPHKLCSRGIVQHNNNPKHTDRVFKEEQKEVIVLPSKYYQNKIPQCGRTYLIYVLICVVLTSFNKVVKFDVFLGVSSQCFLPPAYLFSLGLIQQKNLNYLNHHFFMLILCYRHINAAVKFNFKLKTKL